MSHRWPFIPVLACFAALFLACYASVLFQGQQFGFRDAAHYYYPLYQRVQQEWDAGRIPLWEMEENAGMPLLGNPTAAVLYPLKVIYAVLPYAWAARLYVVAHTILAFAAMLVLMRSWGTSWTGSGLSALAYTFGGEVLFQCCNVIYLVGAAWLPLGVHAVDGWVRRGRRWAILELAVVLAMQTLGGEPQSAYLLGLAGLGYAAGLAWERAVERRRAADAERGMETRAPSAWRWIGFLAMLLIVWVVGTLALGSWVPQFRPHELPPKPLPWMPYASPVVGAVWGLAGAGFLIYWLFPHRRRHGWRMPLGLAWLGLAAGAGLAMALSAAQLLPVMEFTQQSIRAAQAGTHEIYPFSLEPIRLAGLIWPDVLGSAFTGRSSWADLIRLPGARPRVWVPSLYLGGLTIVLALSALAVRRGAPWRVWLSVIVLVSAVGSLGQYTSPIWAVRALAEGKRAGEARGAERNVGRRPAPPDEAKIWPPLRPLIRRLGPLDPEETGPIRQDDFLRDGDGGIYWFMSTFLPGFRQFRFPAKLFTFTSLGLAALAGLGWDAVGRGGSRRATAVCAILLGISLFLLGGVKSYEGPIRATFKNATIMSIFGPFDPEAGYGALIGGLFQGTLVLALGLVAIRLATGRPRLAAGLVLSVATVDLAAANRHYVLTVPQSVLEARPEALRIIEEAERARPQPGPYRVHRLPTWEPMGWGKVASPDRGQEIVRWERDTLQPKYGITLGVEYTHVVGVAELYELEWYYGGFFHSVRDADFARVLQVPRGEKVIYFPRRAFDMWNARYFIVPMWPNGWTDSFRGYASMLIDSEPVFPDPARFRGPGGPETLRDWTEDHDYQIRRNRREHPRAWVVHELRMIEPTEGLEANTERQTAMQEINYENDPIWRDPDRIVFDPHRVAWVEGDPHPGWSSGGLLSGIRSLMGREESGRYARLAAFLRGGGSQASEPVKVTYPSPQRVELEVDLKAPGIVVLADIYYPGWELTIDGVPAPIERVNRAMRGAVVPKGPHRLVYTYAPRSFRIGWLLSVVGLMAMFGFAATCYRHPVDPTVGARDSTDSSETIGHE